jgi:WD40 repeat protein
MRRLLVIFLTLVIFRHIYAQETAVPEPITAANVHRLQSITQIDFEGMDCNFETGGFELSTDGEFIAALDSHRHVYVWNAKGELLYADDIPCDELRNTTHLAVDANHALYTFEQVENALTISKLNLPDASQETTTITSFEAMVLAAWVNKDTVWLEARENNRETVISVHNAFVPQYELEFLAYAPANDTDAVVRIGGIPPPYTVTSSRDGMVKLWNIQTGEVVYEVDNGTGEAAVFGAINSDATRLIWRDSQNEALYLLNFETDENRFIGNLNGQYAQWYFLSNDASVTLAVNLSFEPNIVAWDTTTGEQIFLGDYRECSRPQPDMARLSENGTTLVIGCDTGFDIWRIVPENE